MTTIYGLNSAVAELNLFVSAEKAHHKRRKSELLVGSEDMLLREMVKSVVPKIACQPSETTNYFISLGCMTCTRDRTQLSGKIIGGKRRAKQLLQFCSPVFQQTGLLQLSGQSCQSCPCGHKGS